MVYQNQMMTRSIRRSVSIWKSIALLVLFSTGTSAASLGDILDEVKSVVSSMIDDPATSRDNPFGTISGYDREGGNDTICWKVNVENVTRVGFCPSSIEDKDDTKVEENANSEFDVFTDELYESRNVQAQMLPRCWSGTKMTITPKIVQKPGNERIYTTGWVYTFTIDVVTLPGKISSTWEIAPKDKIWLRLLLCDSRNVGFCNPYLDTRIEDRENSEEGELALDKYKYDEGELLVLKKSSFGQHVFSRFFKAKFTPFVSNEGAQMLRTIVDVSFQVPRGLAGTYFFTAHGVLFLANNASPSAVTLRTDLASAVPNNVIEFEEPAVINEISDGFIIALSILIGIVLLLEFFLFFSILYYCKHTVMKIAQGPFLALLVFCGAVATASCVFYMPVHDIFCDLRGPFVAIPIHMIGTILVGRLWRVHSILAVAMKIGVKERSTLSQRSEARVMGCLEYLAKWDEWFCFKRSRRSKNTQRGPSLRKIVSNADLVRLISVLTIPQVIVQVVKVAVFPEGLELQWDSSGEIARKDCSESCQALTFVGLFLLVLVYLLAVVIAWISGDLPSLFNEKQAIFSAAWINIFVVPVGAALLMLNDSPTSSPDTSALLFTIVTMTLVVSSCWLVVTPKLRKIYSGEKIVVSNLLRSHTASSLTTKSSLSIPSGRQMKLGSDGHSPETAPMEAASPTNGEVARPVVLQRNEPPPTKLEFQLLEMQDVITFMNSSSLEGKQIHSRDWEVLKERVSSLNTALANVQVGWEEEEDEEA